MVNLLTVFEKKYILREYKMRLAVVLLFTLSLLIAVAIVFLIPSYALSSVKYSNMLEQLEVEKKKISSMSEGEDPIKITKDINNKLNILKGDMSFLPDPYYITTTITGHKPDGISISAILYDKNKDEGKVTVSGVSKDRETLLSFLRSTETESGFSSVSLPISSFVKGEDIDFSMRIIVKETSDKKNEEE